MDNVKNQLVERWHFRMLNDVQRNSAFRRAIAGAITTHGFRNILDIGTGTGLLSIYAQQTLPDINVIACEDTKIMLNIAQQVLKINNLEQRVRLLNKYSHDLTETDLGGVRSDLIVTETLDSGVFGEAILQTLIHAKEHLLQPNTGRIIPSRIQMYIAGFESKQIASENVCINNGFADLIYLKSHRLVAKCTEPYDTENVRQIKDFKIITSIEQAFECDFNNLLEMKQCLDGTIEKKVRLDYERAGFLDGFVMWFALTLDEQNVIESKPSVNSCWDQTIFKLNHRFANMEKLKYLNVTVSCKDGILNLSHYYNFPGKVLAVQQDVIKFINDTVYLNKMEFDFFSSMKGRHSKRYDTVLDFSPFPYIGISLMKEKRAQKLYCSKESQDFICFVAFCNCLQFENIVFIDDPVEVLYVGEKFDLIILSPIDTLGCVNSSQISNYTILKTNNLNPNGCMIPHKIELWAELIASDWLARVGRCTNGELDALRVTELMNQFATTNQLNLLSFEHEKLSNPFQVADIQLDDAFAENLVKLKVKCSDKPVNGILYFYKIYVAETAEPISTRRNCSHIRRACFVVDDFKCENAKATVHFVQNHGVIKCCLR